MRLDITLCHSILEYCFANVDHYDRQNKARQLLDEIRRKRVNLNDDVQIYYETYFETKRTDLLEDYQQWFANQIQYADYVKFTGNKLSNPDVVNDGYLRTILNIAYLNEDKIVFSELLGAYDSALSKVGILQMNVNRILDRYASNYYNDYRFPITGKRVSAGESSHDLSNWLKRIIQSETEFTIIDNYIYQERENFKKHFLCHVQHGAKLKIYTILDRIKENDLTKEFSSSDYANWDIELHLISSKREQHARNILTNKYYIQLDKGMRIFGIKGRTDQSDITVGYIKSFSMPKARKLSFKRT